MGLGLLLLLLAQPADQLVDTARSARGEEVPYVLNAVNAQPRYVLILFPGGSGNMNPRMQGDRVMYGFSGNFLIRSRKLMVDEEFATVSTNSTSNTEHIQAVIDDINRRFAGARIYLMGTSAGTSSTLALAGYLSDKIAGEIHTASFTEVRRLDPRKYKNRHLIVHHKDDGCRYTPFFAGEESHRRYGTDFIVMEGGISTGDACEAFAHHGFNGIERETVDTIKAWIRKGG